MPEELLFDPPFEVTLGKSGENHKYDSLKKFKEGIDTEKERWSWLPKTLPSGVDVAEIWNRQNKIIQEVQGLIQQVHQADEAQGRNLMDSIKEKLENYYIKRIGLNSNTPQAQEVVLKLHQNDPEVAVFALAYFLNYVPQAYLSSPKGVIGMFDWIRSGRIPHLDTLF